MQKVHIYHNKSSKKLFISRHNPFNACLGMKGCRPTQCTGLSPSWWVEPKLHAPRYCTHSPTRGPQTGKGNRETWRLFESHRVLSGKENKAARPQIVYTVLHVVLKPEKETERLDSCLKATESLAGMKKNSGFPVVLLHNGESWNTCARKR